MCKLYNVQKSEMHCTNLDCPEMLKTQDSAEDDGGGGGVCVCGERGKDNLFD